MRRRWKYLSVVTAAVMALAGGMVASATAEDFSPPQPCPMAGPLTYTLKKATHPTPDQSSAYDAIDAAMQKAIAFDNCYLGVSKALTVVYDPAYKDTRTWGNLIGIASVRDLSQVAAMYDIAHALGVGTDPQWAAHVSNGVWTGKTATAVLRRITGDPSAVLHADTLNFWPFGLNYDSEVHSADDLRNHCLIVSAMRHDMGLDDAAAVKFSPQG
jgi:sugar phosphate isomerase/epimerase